MLDDYELIEEIARGGMGIVYRARQRRLNRIVAVKILAAGDFARVEAQRRFRTEAETAARLQHPGIVAIHDVGESDGLPWLSMDLVDGPNLAALVREQPLAAREAANYARAIAEAVQHAHDHGVLHRDLKPSNILLDPDAGPRITDFGIARCADISELTRTGEVLGSPGYTAPEQAFHGSADARTDVYGLGAVLYHLLTARPPFQGPTLDAILLQLREAEPIAPRRLNPAVPRDLETICLRCLRKQPDQRYATAKEVADDLARFHRREPIHARPISWGEKGLRWCRQRPALAAALALLLVVIATAFALVDRARRDEAKAKARAESTSTQLLDVNTRLAESLDTAELDRAEDFFRANESAEALALLARIMRRNPAHPVATARLASALWHGDFAIPDASPFFSGSKVTRVQFLRDGKTLLICAHDRIGTWDAAAGRRLLEFEHDGSRFELTRLSPDERTLAAWWDEPGKTLHLYDMATGRRLGAPIPLMDWVHSVSFSPDGARLAAASADHALRLRDARTWQPLGEPMMHDVGQWDVTFSPDGSTIATTAGRTVHLWENATQRLRLTLPALPDDVQRLRFSPDGRWILATCHSGMMRFFSVVDGQPAGLAMRHEKFVTTIDFTADSARLLTASHDNTARLWSVPGGEPLVPPLRHRDVVHFAGFSPDGARVVTCARDHTARLWDPRTGRPLSQPLRHAEQPLTATFTPDSATLYSTGSDGIVRRWDLRAVEAQTGRIFPGRNVEFSADGNRVLAAAPEIVRRDTETLRPTGVSREVSGEGRLARFSSDGRRAAIAIGGRVEVFGLDEVAPTQTITISVGDQINDIHFHPDGIKLVTASANGTARVWDAATGAPMTSTLEHGAPVSTARFSPDGRTLITTTISPVGAANVRTVALLWDALTGQPRGSALQHADFVVATAFSPDGTLVATASKDKTARVWDARNGAPVSPPLQHIRTVEMVAFSPDSRRIVSASWDGTARVWDARTGARLARALTHEEPVLDVQFSPNGQRIATASRDKTVRIWDAASGHPLTQPLRHDAAVARVRFHPDGERLLSSADDGLARIWEVPDFRAPAPAWLAPIADVISLADLPTNPSAARALISRYKQTQADALDSAADNAYTRLAQSLFRRESADHSTPTE